MQEPLAALDGDPREMAAPRPGGSCAADGDRSGHSQRRGALWRALKVAQMVHVPSVALLGLAVAAPAACHGDGWMGGLCRAVPVCLAAAGCFALNDSHDVEKDRVNKPWRAIPSGALGAGTARAMGLCLVGLALALVLFFSTGPRDLLTSMAFCVGCLCYNLVLDHLGACKGAYTAAFLALPIALGLYPLGLPLGTMTPAIIGVIAYVAAKELLMDIWDMPGDAAAGLSTLPIDLGVRPAMTGVLALGLMSLAMFSVARVGLVHVLVAGAVFVSSIVTGCLFEGGTPHRAALYSLWLPLVFMIGSLVAGYA